MPRTYLKPGTGGSGGVKSNNEPTSDFDKLSIKPGRISKDVQAFNFRLFLRGGFE